MITHDHELFKKYDWRLRIDKYIDFSFTCNSYEVYFEAGEHVKWVSFYNNCSLIKSLEIEKSDFACDLSAFFDAVLKYIQENEK